jgi:hypothetical protein
LAPGGASVKHSRLLGALVGLVGGAAIGMGTTFYLYGTDLVFRQALIVG